jgi:aldose sugar dehydrogenase
VIYRQQPKVRCTKHFGSRLVFAPDGTLFVAQGERFDYRDFHHGSTPYGCLMSIPY